MTTLRLILLCLLMVLAVAVIYAGSAAAALVAVWIMDGGAALLWTAAGIGVGFWLLRLLRLDPGGTLRIASAGGLGLGFLGLAVLGLGLAGWLSRPAVSILAAAGLCGWIPLLRRVDGVGLRVAMQKRPADWAIWLVPALMLGLALVAVATAPGILWNKLGDPHAYDVLEYHLQAPREWYEIGRIVGLKHNAFSYFPFAVEMHFLAMMHLMGGPWAGMYAAQFMVLAHMVLAALAVHGVTAALPAAAKDRTLLVAGRTVLQKPPASACDGLLDERSAPRSPESVAASGAMTAAAVSVAALAAVPWTLLLGSIAYNDVGLVLYAALAIAWTIRQETFSWRHSVVGGISAGLACGCKYTGAPMLLVLWPVALLVAGKWQAQRLRGSLVYFAIGVAAFSPWLARNFVWTGNPVFPEAMNQLGRAHFSQRQVERWGAAHSATREQRALPARLHAFWHEIVADGRYGYLLWPVAAGAAVCLWRRREARALAIFVVLLAVFWLGLTHLQSRFFVVASVPAAILVGLLGGSKRGRWWGIAVVFVLPFLPSPYIPDPNEPDKHGHPAPLIHQALWPAAQLQAFGLGNLSQFDPAIKARCESGDKFALIGDARAFLYVMPMANLRYRTVFDVDQRPGQDIVDAWLGPDAAAVRRDYQIVMETSELLRFSRTYRHIELLPSPPPREAQAPH